MRSSTPARLHKCSGCNVVYAVERNPDSQERRGEAPVPDECHVCGGDEFARVHDGNDTETGESTVDGEYSSRSRNR